MIERIGNDLDVWTGDRRDGLECHIISCPLIMVVMVIAIVSTCFLLY